MCHYLVFGDARHVVAFDFMARVIAVTRQLLRQTRMRFHLRKPHTEKCPTYMIMPAVSAFVQKRNASFFEVPLKFL